MKILIGITTYNRWQLLKLLLLDIDKYKGENHIDVIIVDDGTDESVACMSALFLGELFPGAKYLHSQINRGKKGYWKTVDKLYKTTTQFQYDIFIQLPDDVRIGGDFFSLVTEYFSALSSDVNFGCLNLLNDYSRINKALWTPIQNKEVKRGDLKLIATGWVDMCFAASPSLMQALEYRVDEVPQHWFSDPDRSSGVGMQLSKRIVRACLNMYQVKHSLVIHGLHKSKMHPEHRKKVPLITNNEPVTIGIASMPSREKSLQKTISILLPYADEIVVYLNNYSIAPRFLEHKKITVLRSQDEIGDIGDVGKFYGLITKKGYLFTCDDDLVYPESYIADMVAHIEGLMRRSVISLHGRRFDSLPVASYYRGHTLSISCLRASDKDTVLHVGGTGVMAWHSDTVQFPLRVFEQTNMSDVWVAKHLKESGIVISCPKHSAGYITETGLYDRSNTIYAHCNQEDTMQTFVINAMLS